MAAGRQLRLLLWKDYLTRKRNLITLGGVIWAVCVMSSLYIIRINVNNQDFPSCQFPARALPSAGLLNFMQSFICSVDNTCSPMENFTQIPTYENSKLTEVNRQISPLINNETVLDTAAVLPDALKLLATLAHVADNPAFIDIAKHGLHVNDIFKNPKRVRRYLATELGVSEDVANSIVDAEICVQGMMQGSLDRCNVESVTKVLKVKNEEHVKIFVSKICSMSKKVLQKLVIDLLLEVNISKYIKMAGEMYFKISGDDRIIKMGDMTTAVLRMHSLNSFLPPELTTLLKGEEVDFSYINLTMVTQALDLFKPTFGDTEAYKSIRDFADMTVIGIRYLYQFISKKDNNAFEAVTNLGLTKVKENIDINKELDKITNALNDAVSMIGEIFSGDSTDNLFNVLAKATNFIYNFLPAKKKHNFLLYSTLMAKLIEGADQVVEINRNIEQVAYNVSRRNPEGVKMLLVLPSNIVSMGLEALADPERVQYMTDKMDELDKMFCEVDEIQSFFKVSLEEAAKLHEHFCTDGWNNYMNDMLKSFGIFDVRDNINNIARIFVLETIGRDITEFLYTIDKDFDVLKNFSRTLSKIQTHKVPRLNWSELLGIDEDSEILKNAREKSHLGNQVLITVNGALAKEVVKQSPLLEYKITNPLIDATTILVAINEQLDAAPADAAKRARHMYPEIIETILLTALDENKTYRATATPSEEIFCNGVENARSYVELPSSGVEELVATLCDVSVIINTGLSADSLFGKSIATVKNTTHGPLEDVDWFTLITALKQLYIKLDKEYPYLFEYKTYGMHNNTQQRMDDILRKATDFWFSRKTANRSIHISLKLVLRLLDLLDRRAFDLKGDQWLQLKRGLGDALGPLAAASDFLKLLGAISRNDNATSGVPPAMAGALRRLLAGLPRLVADTADIVVKGDTDVEQIIAVMNADPPWPCSRGLATVLPLSGLAQEALGGLETLLCMDRGFQEQWAEYRSRRHPMALESQEGNNTVFPPHLFLKFSEVFSTAVADLDSIKDFLQSLFDSGDGISFVASIEYAVDSFNTSERDVVLRNFFSKLDTVLNAINTSSVEATVPLNTLWRNYLRCSGDATVEDYCWQAGRAAWKYTLKFVSVALGNMAEDLLTYFRESNEPNVSVLKLFGFTSGTGLYTMYEQFPEFVGVLLNSYWDLGFMSQVRRALHTDFWDCEAVLAALVPPPGSPVDQDAVQRAKPFICPSLLYWISLPRGDNVLLDVISKPQYFFFTIEADNLVSGYEKAFNKTNELVDFLDELANKSMTAVYGEQSEDMDKVSSIDSTRSKLEETVDKMLLFKISESDTSYRLFNEVNKKQFIASIYLTRITAITDKLSKTLGSIKINDIQVEGLSGEEIKKIEAELVSMQRTFKRRPTEIIALHFDLLTDILWRNDENFKLTDSMSGMCEKLKIKDTSKDILSDTDRIKLQICSKNFGLFYKIIEKVVDDDREAARTSLLNLVNMLQNDDARQVTDIFKFFNERQQVVNSLKTSIKYAYELGLPVYLQYLHSNVRQYGIVISFLSGQDWWGALVKEYSGPHVSKFLQAVERSFDIVEDVLTNLDKVQLVRLLRDMNMNSSKAFCREGAALREYLPDGTGLLTELQQQACSGSEEVVGEVPPLLFAAQGYVSGLKLSNDVDYGLLNADLSDIESKLQHIKGGPKDPMRPKWITDQNIVRLKRNVLNVLSRDSLTKISFGLISNLVDAGTLFLNNSQCTLCSQLTAWVKQLNLQLYKKQEYDALLCHIDQLGLEEVHHALKNDFHWDMAVSELVSTRNYTKYELNKSLNEFLEQVKLHLLEDLSGSRVAACLASNVSENALGNATLFTQVLAHTTRLFRAELPHLQEVPGLKNLRYFKKLHASVAHNLDVDADLKKYLKKKYDLKKALMKIVGDKRVVEDIENAQVNLRKVRELRTGEDSLRLKQFSWREVCSRYNCSDILAAVRDGINESLVDEDLPKLQKDKFWQFEFIASILEHEERFLGHAARLLGVASRADVGGVRRGRLGALLDLGIQLMMDDEMDSVLYSVGGVLEELRPVVAGSALEYDTNALATGLDILRRLKNDLVDEDLILEVSELFPDPERLEAALAALGVNNTNFWSVAAPRVHAGHVALAPIFTPKQDYHIEDFVCQIDSMSRVIIPEEIDVVTPEDVYGAIAEQFCGLGDERAKEVLMVLMQNLNYTLILDKVKTTVMSQLFAASNLTQPAGERVLASFADMAAVLPDVQQHMDQLSETLATEPLLLNFKNSRSVGAFVSSGSFMSDAGNMLCGKSFEMDLSRYYKVISSVQDQTGGPDQAQLDVLPTDFCRSLYTEVVRMRGGKIVWSFAKPLVLGKILYTPDTPLVRRIIEKANSTFTPMVKLTNLIHAFAAAFSSLELLSEHKAGAAALASLLSSPEYTELRASLLGDVELGDLDVDQLFDGLGDIQEYKSMLSKASDLLRCISLDRFRPVEDEEQLKLEAGRLTRVNEFAAGLVFLTAEESDDIPAHVEYKIRMDIENAPTTKRLRNYLWIPGPESNFLENMRYFRGFVQIQDIIDKAIIDLSAESSRGREKRAVAEKNMDWALYTQQIPYPCYRKDFFQTTLYETQSLMVAFFFSMLFSVTSAVRLIVQDKESGNTMLMSIMGVKIRYHTLSWFLLSSLELAVTVAGMTAMLSFGRVLPRSDPSLLLALLLLYGFSVVTFCYMMSKMFTAASFAAVCTGLGVLTTYMPFVLILSLEGVLSSSLKMFVCLFMSSAMTYGMWFVTRFEAMGVGAHWSHLSVPMEGSEMTLGYAMIMVFVDGLIYIAVGIILDRFFGFKARHNAVNCTTSGEKAGVSIVNVSKVYHAGGRRAKLALDNVSVELHQGQITTLLGHNGAGKTTLINILTGLLQPTKGHVVIRSDGGGARLGVCPQRDVLFEQLTAREHVALYAQLQSDRPLAQLEDEVVSILSVLSLGLVADEPVSRLSGGTRRRLCVALAFVAQPSLVSLDEPTSGVDPAARREIWSMIMKLRENRTILLTTHHLDEAELLSDQIVIMHKGQIHTTGSPIDIKRTLGTGYKLTAMFPERRLPSPQAPADDCIEEKTKQLLALTRTVVKNANLVDVNGLEVEINLPFFDADGVSNNFLELCKALEASESALGCRSMALDCSSLEQVFFQICQQADAPAATVAAINAVDYEPSCVSSTDTATKSASGSSERADREPLVPPAGPLRGSALQQLRALLYARYLHYIRNRWLLFMLIILPSLFVSIAMGFSTIRPPADTEVSLKLTRDLYEPRTDFLVPQPSVFAENVDDTLARQVLDILKYDREYRNWTSADTPSCQCVDSVVHRCELGNVTLDRPALMLLPDVPTLNAWLVDSQQLYVQKRYGGFTAALQQNRTYLVAWYNNKGHHALPAYLNAANSALLRATRRDPTANITVYTHPLKISNEQLNKASAYQHVADAGISCMLLIGYSLVSAGSCVYLVTSRRNQEKRLQLLCGVSPALHTAAALAWDLMIILINLAITVVVLAVFRFPVFVYGNNLPAISLLVVLYGYACANLVHVLEKLFSEPSMANMMLFCGNTFVGVVGITLLLILDVISESETTDNARWVLHKILLISPQFTLGDGLLEIATNTIQALVLKQFGMDTYRDPLTGPARLHYIALASVGTLLLLLSLALEYDCFEALRARFGRQTDSLTLLEGDVDEDEEIARERARVRSEIESAAQPLRLRTIGNINAGFVESEVESAKPAPPSVGVGMGCDVAACEGLGKVFPMLGGSRSAVRGLTLGIPPGQCTALLGQNGAGKSTTFAMLTGQLRPTAGRVCLQGKPVSNRDLCTGLISYCPQSDAVDPLLTVSETLRIYCMLRGISDQKEVIRRTIEMFDLTKYERVRAGALSGGNRRKLCTAVAFMGRAPLVLLDEPTSGMDPASRACVARGVRVACASGRAVLLSTHALDDARRLAARVALVRAGRLCALAPLDECLKRFGGGYVVACRVRRGGARAAWAAARALAPHARLRVMHHAAMHLLLPAQAAVDEKEVTTKLSDVFALAAALQAAGHIEDYTINQSSLDQMFLNFTDKNKEDLDGVEIAARPAAQRRRYHSDELNSVTAL